MTRHRRMSSDLDGSQTIEVTDENDPQVVITEPDLSSSSVAAAAATPTTAATSTPTRKTPLLATRPTDAYSFADDFDDNFDNANAAAPPQHRSSASQGTEFFSPHNSSGSESYADIPQGRPFGNSGGDNGDDEEPRVSGARSSSTGSISGGSVTLYYSDTSMEHQQQNQAFAARRSKRDREYAAAAAAAAAEKSSSSRAAAMSAYREGSAGDPTSSSSRRTQSARQLDPDVESQTSGSNGGGGGRGIGGFGGMGAYGSASLDGRTSTGGGGRSSPASSDSPSNMSWVAKLAYSFRSPPVSSSHKRISNHHHAHRQTFSFQHGLQVVPNELRHQHHHSYDGNNDRESPGIAAASEFAGLPLSSSTESTPLIKERKVGEPSGPGLGPGPSGRGLGGRRTSSDRSMLSGGGGGGGGGGPGAGRNLTPQETEEEARRVRIAAAFLGDYVSSRPPSLPCRLEAITDRQLRLHEIKYSTQYKVLVWLAVLLLFVSCGFEYFRVDTFAAPDKLDRRIMTAMNLLAIAILCVDLLLLHSLRTSEANLDATFGRSTKGSFAMPPSLSYYYFDEDPSNVFMSARVQPRRGSMMSVGGDTIRDIGGATGTIGSGKSPNAPRSSDSHRLIKPMIVFAAFLTVENLARVLVVPQDTSALAAAIQDDVASSLIASNSDSTPESGVILISSFFKPLVLFYVSSQARHALEALRRILRMATRVLVMESLLILMFAAVGCRLFAGYEQFDNLSTAWLSLFELSTTVTNPSIWMPMYRDYKANAIFFIVFVVICVFYLHSLVLSVVFSTYIYAAGEIFERAAADREDSLRLAYRALAESNPEPRNEEKLAAAAAASVTYGYQGGDGGGGGGGKGTDSAGVKISRLRPLLKRMRPHYSAAKISALWEIMEPYVSKGGSSRIMDYPTFRQKIRQALNASIRTPRNASTTAMAVEILAVIVAVVNFAYVIMASCQLEEPWFDDYVQAIIGGIITVIASAELLVRFNPLRIADFTPLTRLNTTFDGLALLGAAISIVGIALLPQRPETALEVILTGRAVDMIRIMRFFRIFRDVVRRSTDVVPVLVGPAILVLSTLHVFVYLGIALWGGAVRIGENPMTIESLYDLNNFNGYQEGVVTMFQVLVVNDWNAIAKVFLGADRCSHPWIVYPFFVLGNLIGVSIMLNVLTAFFVESFVTKINEDSDDNVGSTDGGKGSGPTNAVPTTPTRRKDRNDFTIQTPENSQTVRRISSSTSSLYELHPHEASFDAGGGGDVDFDDSVGSDSEFYEFDVYERQGLEKIMQTVAGVGSSTPNYNSDFARQLCDYFETFEALSSEREPVGFLVCDQLTMERFGNRRFQLLSVGFMEATDLHQIVSDMHSELLALAARIQDRSLLRTFHEGNRVFEISATLLRRHPALSLFVTRVKVSPPA